MYNRNDYKEAGNGTVFWAFVIALVLLAAWGVKILVTPAAIVGKTLDADNVITKYEWFYDAAGVINSRVAQVAAHRTLVANTTDPAEKSRLNIEIAGMQQSCRQMMQQYNANASKVNVALFKTAGTPASFSPSTCE